MKIGYLCHPFDSTGYCNAAIPTILALDSVGIDVTVLPVKLASQSVAPPKRILELIDKSDSGITHLISHTLPHYLTWVGPNKYNIGFFHSETSNFKASGWSNYLNLMDSVWTSCNQNKECAINSGITKPIHVIPIGYDQNKYNQNYGPSIINKQNRFVFLCISDYSVRKNIKQIIKSYLEEFTHLDNVLLVLKTYVDGKSAQQSQEIIQKEIQEIKDGLRKNSFDLYPKIVVITDYLSNEQILNLQTHSDCYITAERGAGYGLGAFDALVLNKYVIYSEGPGHCDFLAGQPNTFPVRSDIEKVWGMNSCPYKNLYTAHETWFRPNPEILSSQMRYVFTFRPNKGLPNLNDYTYESIGNKMKDILLNAI
jgi:glycosyltransferase involved in cell wall biosynthesis